MTPEEKRDKERARKRRARRRARGFPEDLLVLETESPEDRKHRQREWARIKYRRARGLPDDAVLRPTPEESREMRLATKRKNEHKRLGSVSRAEYLANLAEKRAEKERAAEAAKMAKIRDRAIRAARRAEEREARCRMVKRSTNGTKRKSASISPVTVRKPGRITAMCGWMGW